MAGRIVKMLLVGDSQVGKTCMMRRFVDDSFVAEYVSTIGVDFSIRLFSDPQNPDVPPAKLQIWDTAGQERFRTITTAYYRGAMGILLVYDVTDEASFNNIRNWIRNIEQHAADNVDKILVGNKCDMVKDKVVDTARGQALADEYGIKFFETSAKTNTNVVESFTAIAKDIKKRLMDNPAAPQQPNIRVDSKNTSGSGKGGSTCCK